MRPRFLLAPVAALVAVLIAQSGAVAQYPGAEAKLKCPSSALPGATITVSGEGFAPTAAVKVKFSPGLGIDDVDIIADLQGKIELPVTLATTSPAGDHEISAHGRGNDGGSLTLKCMIKVELFLDATDSRMGSILRSGGGWPAGVILTLILVVGFPYATRKLWRSPKS